MAFWEPILQGLYVFLPAYMANMSPVFSAKLAPRWSAPIDGGRMHRDGKRVLGDGKTWRGLVGGGLLAGLTALLLGVIAPPYDGGGALAGWDFGLQGFAGPPIGFDGVSCTPDGQCSTVDASSASWYAIFLFGFVVGLFALVGDAVESFVKRRLGKERGAPWFPFDQLDFVVFGLLGMVVASPLLPTGWVQAALTDHWGVLITIIVGTPALHLLVNRIGYWLRLKDVPW